MRGHPLSESQRNVRDMLLHLNDAGALRKNPLARRLAFPGSEDQFIASLQAFVLSVLPHGSRMAAIVQACDIEGQPHKVVAARLGISMRHFYRERSRAIELVLETLAVRQYVRVEHDGRDILADELETLHQALEYGHTDNVVERVAALFETGVPADFTPSLHALRARAFAEGGQQSPATAELERARLTTGDDWRAVAETAFAHGCMLIVQSQPEEAARWISRAVETSAPHYRRSERDLRLHARYLAALGALLGNDHDPAGSLQAQMTARETLLSCAIVPQSQVLMVCSELAATRLAIPDMVDHAIGEALETYRAATWHGLTSTRNFVEIILAFAELTQGDVAAALRRVSATNSLFTGAAGAALARQYLLVSRIQTAAGKPHAALASITAARAAVPAGHFLEAFVDLRAAEALNAAGNAADALPAAQIAIARAPGGERSHYAGAAHLAVAKALHGLDRNDVAREHCEVAVDHLRAGAMVHDLAGALRFAGALTGDASYYREERRLLAG